MEVYPHAFFNLAVDGSDWLASCPSRFNPRERARYPTDRRLVGPQIHSGRGDEELSSQPMPGLEALIIQPVAN